MEWVEAEWEAVAEEAAAKTTHIKSSAKGRPDGRPFVIAALLLLLSPFPTVDQAKHTAAD